MSQKKKAIVIGTGAGGAIMARELQKKYDVTILEAGKEFHPFTWPVDVLAKFRSTGLFFDERLIRLLLPNMVIDPTDDMILVSSKGIGGTTTLATGNAVRYDQDLRDMGIDLDEEFAQLYSELPITTDHQKDWTETTVKMYELFQEMHLDPIVTPKLMNAQMCTACGHCAIGCPTGAKWDARVFVQKAVDHGAVLCSGRKVTGMKIEDSKVKEVYAMHHGHKETYTADLIVCAAGGLGTSVILENSGIACQKSLFVDPVLCVAGPLKDLGQDRQVLMPFISQQDGYILSPYIDYLSFFFNKKWRLPMNGIASIMIKLADEEKGYTDGRKVHKTMTALDQKNMDKAVAQCHEILTKMGIPEEEHFLGTLNAGHPGGTLPLTEKEKDTLHHPSLPDNLYVADASLLPHSMGNPPILTIMALSLKIAGILNRNA